MFCLIGKQEISSSVITLESKSFLLKETTEVFDVAQTHDWLMTSQMR